MNGQEFLQKLKNYFKKCKKLIPDVTDDMLRDEGDNEKIYYVTGNNKLIGKSCEFMTFYKSTGWGCIKVFVDSDDTISAYIYNENYKIGDKPIKAKKVILKRGEALYFLTLMYNIANKQEHQLPISKLDFDYEVTEEDIKKFKREMN